MRAELDAQRIISDQLRHQATHDPLTGLANRAAILGRLGAALEPGRGTRAGLCYVDLDGFKQLTSSYDMALFLRAAIAQPRFVKYDQLRSASFPPTAVGARVRIHGHLETDRKHGEQLRAESLIELAPVWQTFDVTADLDAQAGSQVAVVDAVRHRQATQPCRQKSGVERISGANRIHGMDLESRAVVAASVM